MTTPRALALLALLAQSAACGDDGDVASSAGGGSAGSSSGGSPASSGSAASDGAGAGPVSTASGSGAGGQGGGGGGGGDDDPGFAIGGTVIGLEGSLTLEDVGGATLVLDGDGPFTLASGLPDGAVYDVAITSAPGLSRCRIDAASGVVDGADVTELAVRCDRKLLFWAHDGTERELWITDGTPEGTEPLADVNPTGDGWDSSSPIRELRVGDGTALFIADDGASGEEVFVTDGTAAGTRLLRDINPVGTSGPDLFAVIDGRRWFRANDDFAGSEIWVSDGTEAGTELAVDLGPVGTSGPELGGVIGDRLVVRDRTLDGEFVWFATDGTSAGTVQLLDPVDLTNALLDPERVSLGNVVLFPWETPAEASVEELWVTDGTAAGTKRLVAPNGGTDPGPNSDIRLTAAGGVVWMAVGTSELGREPWVSDGTAEGTGLLLDLAPGPVPSDPSNFLELGAEVAFTASPTANNSVREIYLSDGTPDGTRVLDLDLTGQYNLVAGDGARVFFIASGGLHVTDGTTEGTHLATDLPSGYLWSAGFVGDVHVFWTGDGANGHELYATDGTPEGSGPLADICPGACSALTGN